MKKSYRGILIATAAAVLGSSTMTAMATTYQMPDGGYIDPDYYVNSNADLEGLRGDIPTLYRHYLEFGAAEGRLPYNPANPGEVAIYQQPAPAPVTEEKQTQEKESESQAQEAESEVDLSDIVVDNDGRSVLFETRDLSHTKKNSNAKLEAYLKGSAFVGDSIMLGFRNYATKRKDSPLLSSFNFLAAGSFSARNALGPVNKDSTHPVFRGQKRKLDESLAMMKYGRIYVMLGMNDIAPVGLEGSRDNYQKLLKELQAVNPQAGITILSVTYVQEGKGKGKLNSSNIKKYNSLLKQMAAKNGWDYINLADILSDGKGNLRADYCSDGFVHLSASAYDKWMETFYSYADLRLEHKK